MKGFIYYVTLLCLFLSCEREDDSMTPAGENETFVKSYFDIQIASDYFTLPHTSELIEGRLFISDSQNNIIRDLTVSNGQRHVFTQEFGNEMSAKNYNLTLARIYNNPSFPSIELHTVLDVEDVVAEIAEARNQDNYEYYVNISKNGNDINILYSSSNYSIIGEDADFVNLRMVNSEDSDYSYLLVSDQSDVQKYIYLENIFPDQEYDLDITDFSANVNDHIFTLEDGVSPPDIRVSGLVANATNEIQLYSRDHHSMNDEGLLHESAGLRPALI